MTAIGILGGMGPQASARLHTLLIREAPNYLDIKKDTDFPEIVHISVPVPNFIHDKTDFEASKAMLINRAKILELAGCSVNAIACNTAHLLIDDLREATRVSFISIPELVAVNVRKYGHKKVGLLATPSTLDSRLYDDAIGTDTLLIRPDAQTLTAIEQLIFRQLNGLSTKEDTLALRKIAEQFKQTRQLDAVILGCTELPLIFGDTSDHTIISTLDVLTEGLLLAYKKSILN